MIIQETGEGLPSANAYASVEAFLEYCEARNLAVGEATPSVISAALIRATDYIDSAYVFRSVRLNNYQALQNPRYLDDGLSPQLVAATIELAFLALSQDLFAAPVRGIVSKEVSAGKASSKTTYDAAQAVTDPYPAITRMLRTIASRVGSSIRVGMMTR